VPGGFILELLINSFISSLLATFMPFGLAYGTRDAKGLEFDHVRPFEPYRNDAWKSGIMSRLRAVRHLEEL